MARTSHYMRLLRLVKAVVGLSLLVFTTGAAPPPPPTTPAATVDSFHAALEAHDAARALGLLSQKLSVCEFGVIDPSRDAYAFTHLPIDMNLAAQSQWTLKSRMVSGTESVRWVISSYDVKQVTPDNQSVDQTVLETVVLERNSVSYSIVHIHWSSLPIKAK
jgi:SnoaL-like domain